MLTGFLTKYLLPAGIAAALLAGFAGGSYFGAKILAPAAVPCPDVKLSCPECEKCPPQVELDKVKNFKGTLKIEQFNTVEINGDSLTILKIREALKAELDKLNVRKCR